MPGSNEENFKEKLEKQISLGRNSAPKTSDYAPEEPVVNEPKRIVKPQTEAQKKLADLLKNSVPSKEANSEDK
ncbi:hypothetical protein GAYE_PCTG50G1163 [Galdieria yellowstonensis]|uniref:Uncharacterized protein n=1 Tax=Galdieria yellowstonensis TaxID=3028027 RepID=A0AAV9I4I5_9RHOD|nr:hypothetical protein GAYE_PCTG50G1163 [Galdieria yellowstonensis]